MLTLFLFFLATIKLNTEVCKAPKILKSLYQMRWFFHRRAFAGNDAKSEKKAVYNVSFTLRMTLTLTIFIFIVMSYPPPFLNTQTSYEYYLVFSIKSSMIGTILFLSNCSGFNNSLLVNSQCISNWKKGKFQTLPSMDREKKDK